MCARSRELLAPGPLESAGPFVERSEPRCVRAIENLAAVAPDVYKADVAKDSEVLGYRRLGEAQGRDDVTDGMRARRP